MEAELEKKRRRRSSQEITALIEEYRQSGQTRREFCQSHGLALSSFQSSIRRRVVMHLSGFVISATFTDSVTPTH